MGSMALWCICVLMAFQVIQTQCLSRWDFTSRNDARTVLCTLGCECPRDGQQPMFLDCGKKNISRLPSMIQFDPEVQAVTFHGNGIRNISETTFFLAVKVQELDMSQNKLSLISDSSFMAFRSLNLLRLSHNRLSRLPLGLLDGLKNLRVLELGHNQLQSLPVTLFQPTPDLREVRLQHNKFDILPDWTFRFLPELERVDLEGNGLKLLPNDLFRFSPRLQWLSLSENHFEKVPKEALGQSTKLNSLDLSGNDFPVLERGSFSSLGHIASLYLNNQRRLSRIEKDAFANMTGLKMLHCSYNGKLSYIHPEAFGANVSASRRSPTMPSEHLYLRHNALKSLQEPGEVGSWAKLAYVDLRENPWRCDCEMRWMKKLELASSVRCQSPFMLHGRTIGSIPEEELVCDAHWMFSTIVLTATSLVAFFVCLSFAIMLACYKTPLGLYVRAQSQFSYAKVLPKKECVDLEWDPSGEM